MSTYHCFCHKVKNNEEFINSGTLSFPTEDLCIATFGSRNLYVVATGKRLHKLSNDWVLLNNKEIYEFEDPISILHSNMDRNVETLHILLMSVKDIINEKSSCILHWLQIKVSNEEPVECTVKGRKCFKGGNIPKACWFDVNFNHFYICSEQQYHLVNPKTYGEHMINIKTTII